MAIAFVKEVGHLTGISGTSKILTVAAAPAAGNLVVLSVATNSSVIVSSVTDSKGNTWAVDKTVSNGTSESCSVASTVQNVGALTTSDTITVNFSASASSGAMAAHEFSGCTNTVDQTSSQTAVSTSRKSGTTATTTNANDLVWAAYSVGGTETGLTPAAGYSAPTPAFYSSTVSVEFDYQIVSATGAFTPTGTGGSSHSSAGACVVYKASSGAVANTLTASPGSMAITGSPTALPVGRNLPASPGTYAVTGTAVGLTFGRKFAASPGAFSVTGSPTTSKVARKLSLSPGSYAISGSPVTPQAGRKLTAAPASYAVTGSATTLPVGRKFSASPASYVITGTATTLVFTPGGGGAVAYTLSVVPGSVAITGSTVKLPAGRKMSASPASYSITGVSTLAPLARKLTAGPGAIAVTGASATLVGSGAPVVQVDINVQRPYVSLWIHPF